MIVIEKFISCDKCGRNFGVDNRSFSIKQHRENAKVSEWRFIRGRDICPMCYGFLKNEHRNQNKHG